MRRPQRGKSQPSSTTSGDRTFSWRPIPLVDLFLLSTLILSTRLATFLHEAMGHGLAAALFGAKLTGIRLSLFGGGNAYYHFDTAVPALAAFLVAFSGILVNLLTGGLSLRYALRPGIRPPWRLFLSLFGMVSLLGGLSYACLGLYYRVGDPAAWMRNASWGTEWHWIPFFAACPLVAHMGVRSFLAPLRVLMPGKGFLDGVVLLIVTLGVTTCAYAGLYGLTRQRSVALETPTLAHNRAVETVRAEKRAELYRALREAFPDLSEEETAQLVARTPIHVRPEDVPGSSPILPLLALCQILGALTALLRVPPPAPVLFDTWFTPRRTLTACVTAAAVLAFLAGSGGWIWRPGVHIMSILFLDICGMDSVHLPRF